ncbi:MAG: PQQ-binding-like beta-propeller repeat protein [candidate division WOR-3 bacterium]|nr:MAG: PQQ-binding-like beta-propeller repeat protein [candidate division WOR-3 bacterium]
MNTNTGLGPLVICCLAALLMMNCPAAAPSIPMVPFAGVVGDSLAFFTTATEPKGHDIMFVFDLGDGSMDTTPFVKSGDSGYVCHSFPDTGTYSIRARAVNRAGRESDWSGALEFSQSQPPHLDSCITGQTWCAARSWVKFKAVAADPEGDSVAARFSWGSGLPTEWTTLVASGDTIVDSVKYPWTGVCTVRVTLRDQGYTIGRPASGLPVKVTQAAVNWCTAIDEAYYDASLVLGMQGDQLVIYAVREDEELACFDTEGHVLWEQWLDVFADYSPSLSRDCSRLYLGDDEHGIVCHATATGTLVWHLDSVMCEGTPAIGPDGALYVTCPDRGTLSKVVDDGESAHVEWSLLLTGEEGTSTGATIGPDGTVYVAAGKLWDEHTRLFAVNPDGSIRWQDSTTIDRQQYEMPPVFDSEGRILFAGEEAGIYCFYPDGSLAWHQRDIRPGECGMAVAADNSIYVSGESGHIHRITPDGELDWTSDYWCGDDENTPALASNGTIFVHSPEDDALFALSPTGTVLWQCWMYDSIVGDEPRPRPQYEGYCPSPVVAPDGNIYLGSEGLGIHSVSCGEISPADAPWPTYNHDAARSGFAGRED